MIGAALPEAADVLAWLAQRRDNCAAMETRADGEAALAGRIMRRQLDVVIGEAGEGSDPAQVLRIMARQLDVLADDMAAGLHHGSALVRAALLAGRGEVGDETWPAR